MTAQTETQGYEPQLSGVEPHTGPAPTLEARGTITLRVGPAPFSALASCRRHLQRLRCVVDVRIAGYDGRTAVFTLVVTPGTSADALVLPRTRIERVGEGELALAVT